jgi:alpha-L-fucosidase 2
MVFSCSKERIEVNQVPMKWWYDKPAGKYWEGLPVGTGRFVAMLPGDVGHEVIPFNDETLWTGGPYNPARSDGPQTIAKIREYAFARNWKAASEESRKLFGDPVHVQFYQPMAQLNKEYHGHDFSQVDNYRRELDMDNGLANLSYDLSGVKYSRRAFASFPDQAIVYHLDADKKGKINLSIWFTSLQPSAKTYIEDGVIVMEGTTVSEKPGEIILPPQMLWQSRVKAVCKGGTQSVDKDKVIISGADEVMLILTGATNWVNYNDVSADEKKICGEYLSRASQYSYSELLRRHSDDYHSIFDACKIELVAEPYPDITTTQAMDDKLCRLRTPNPVKVFADGKEISVKEVESGLIEFDALAGKIYSIGR